MNVIGVANTAYMFVAVRFVASVQIVVYTQVGVATTYIAYNAKCNKDWYFSCHTDHCVHHYNLSFNGI